MKQQMLRENAYSREAETCRKRPRETPEYVKAHSFSQNFSLLRIVGCQKSGGTQVSKKFIEAFNDIFSTCCICDGSSGGDDGVFLIEQLLRFIRQERDARAALGQRAALRALFGEQLRVRALGLAGGGCGERAV